MTSSRTVLAPTRSQRYAADTIEFRQAMSRSFQTASPELRAKMLKHTEFLINRNLKEIPIIEDENSYYSFIMTAEEIVSDRQKHAQRCARANKKRLAHEAAVAALEEAIFS